MRTHQAILVVLCILPATLECREDGRALDIRRMLGAGRYEEAFARTRGIVESVGDGSDLYALLAESGQYAGRAGEADSILGTCIRKGRGVGSALCAMAWLDVHRARWMDAYAHFQTAKDYGGNQYLAYAGIQEMHEKLHGRDAAISHLLALTHAHDRSGPVWYALALAYWGQWDLTKAQFAVEQALRAGPPDPRVQSLSLAIRCMAQPDPGNLGRVDGAYDDARARGDWEGTAFLQWVRMSALRASGNSDSSMVRCLEGLHLAHELGMVAWEGQFLLERGRDASAAGDIQRALAATDAAAERFHRAGAHDGILAAYALRLDLLLESSRYAEALDYCSRMLLQIDDRADPRLHAGAAIDAAWILSRIGGERIAIILGIQAESTLESMLYASHDRCRLNTTLAAIHAGLGDSALAMRYGRTAMDFARSAGTDPDLIGHCEGVLGDLEFRRHHDRAARTHFKRQWELGRQARDPREQRGAAVALARTRDPEQEAAEALRWANAGLGFALHAGDRFSEKDCRLIRGRIAIQRRDTAQAYAEYDRAYRCLDAVRRLRFLCSLTREMRDWYVRQYAEIADALIEAGAVRRAAAIMARAREEVLFPLYSFSQGVTGETGRQLLALERSRRSTASLVHRSMLRGGLEDAAYSDSVLRSLCTFFAEAVPAFLRLDAGVRAAGSDLWCTDSLAGAPGELVEADEVALEFIPGPGHTHVIGVTRDTVALCNLTASRETFGSIAEGSIAGREGGIAGGLVQVPGGILPGPLEPLVEMVHRITGRRSRIAIIGDGPLTLIPFEALLYDAGHGPRMLIERCAVSYRPSLRMPPVPVWVPRGDNGRVLVVGDVALPLDGRVAPGDVIPPAGERHPLSGVLQPLPGSIAEMSLVEHHFGSRVDILRGGDATDVEFCARAPGYWIVHLATHGAARAPGRSEHVLYMSSASSTGGEVSMDELLSLEMRGSLVVLPVCSAGQPSLTNDVESIAHAFLEAGAGSVLAARWSVDDDLAVEFLASFYEGLGRGESRAGAVRTAMHAMIARGHHSYRVWAGFQLIGDGGVLPVPVVPEGAGLVRGWMIVAAVATMSSVVAGYLWRRRRPGLRVTER